MFLKTDNCGLANVISKLSAIYFRLIKTCLDILNILLNSYNCYDSLLACSNGSGFYPSKVEVRVRFTALATLFFKFYFWPLKYFGDFSQLCF